MNRQKWMERMISWDAWDVCDSSSVHPQYADPYNMWDTQSTLSWKELQQKKCQYCGTQLEDGKCKACGGPQE